MSKFQLTEDEKQLILKHRNEVLDNDFQEKKGVDNVGKNAREISTKSNGKSESKEDIDRDVNVERGTDNQNQNYEKLRFTRGSTEMKEEIKPKNQHQEDVFYQCSKCKYEDKHRFDRCPNCGEVAEW